MRSRTWEFWPTSVELSPRGIDLTRLLSRLDITALLRVALGLLLLMCLVTDLFIFLPISLLGPTLYLVSRSREIRAPCPPELTDESRLSLEFLVNW